MNTFEERTMLPKLYNEGFIKVNKREVEGREQEYCAVYFEYYYEGEIYSDVIDYYTSYKKIKPRNYTRRLNLARDKLVSRIEKFKDLNKKAKNFGDIERLIIIGFIGSQINSTYKHLIKYTEYEKIQRQYEADIKSMIKIDKKPMEIYKYIKTKYSPSKITSI